MGNEMNHKMGDYVFLVDFNIDKRRIFDSRCRDGKNVYFLENTFGDFSPEILFKTKNEAIDYLIKELNSLKESLFRVDCLCSICRAPINEMAGLISTDEGEFWVATCKNEKCDHEVRIPVNKTYGVKNELI